MSFTVRRRELENIYNESLNKTVLIEKTISNTSLAIPDERECLVIPYDPDERNILNESHILNESIISDKRRLCPDEIKPII
jgi:hypothetical protein